MANAIHCYCVVNGGPQVVFGTSPDIVCHTGDSGEGGECIVCVTVLHTHTEYTS